MMMYAVQEDHEYASIYSHLNEHEQKPWRKQLEKIVVSQVLKEMILEWKEKLDLRQLKNTASTIKWENNEVETELF